MFIVDVYVFEFFDLRNITLSIKALKRVVIVRLKKEKLKVNCNPLCMKSN